MTYERALGDVVETLRRVVERGRRCTLLIGAGCSKSAGIPLAREFVEMAREEYSRSYAHANPKDYPHVMAALSPGERRELIAGSVDRAKINWAHIGIAELMKEGYIDRVLTTNFDPLVVRAAAMTGVYPAVYDFAASQAFSAADLPDNAVFHLHGQRTGFALMNTPEEVASHSERMRPVFEDAGRGRCWLVVGYSGINDPVFDHLAAVPRFDDRLYWIGYRDADPDEHVRRQLLEGDKWAFYVRGFDPDSFFIALARQLPRRVGHSPGPACFPPEYIGKPFTHLGKSLGQLTKYPVQQLGDRDTEPVSRRSGERQASGPSPRASAALGVSALDDVGAESDITVATSNAIEQAKRQHEEGDGSALAAWADFLAGRYASIVEIAERNGVSGDFGEPAYWSFIEAARAELDLAREHTDLDYESWAAHVRRAVELFDAAAGIKPDERYRYEDWGEALMLLGRYDDAVEKFEAAHRANGANHRVLAAWGRALASHAGGIVDDETARSEVYESALGKYKAALRLRPNDYGTLNDWAVLLLSQARNASTRRRARTLYTRAVAKLDEALAASPESFEPTVRTNASIAMRELSGLKSEEHATHLKARSVEYMRRAAELRPFDPAVQYELGVGLAVEADSLDGDDAGDRYAEAIELWEMASQARPDDIWLPLDIALAYMRSARLVDDTEAAARLSSAMQYLETVEDDLPKKTRSLQLSAYLADEAQLRADLAALEAVDYDRAVLAGWLEAEVRYQRDPSWLREQIAALEEA